MVSREGALLRVLTGETSPAQVLALLDAWYAARAGEVCSARLAQCHRACPQLGVDLPELRIRRMRRSWGTCTSRGRIHLNWELVKTPPPLIDYVITHELCHLVHHNHSPEFYRLLGDCLPDWRCRREQLEKYLIG